ncbi:polysaccharide lyase 8 family protein [Nocardioides sp. KC13]|uniref:Polysaccharide lyase 8 family protein n=1 Tax=Nocardioides turkmenicus TaxID=2711220 RepID=A0A6M1R191_9ACTN|nr:polysaccharide lyase 8 family protein [Nocardioides sp. KC13]NGN93760.1 polysaccharide lyase 8 family protein [Nocardioides sp. KC13]
MSQQSPGVARRTLLGAGISTAALIGLARFAPESAALEGGDQFDALRVKWVEQLTGGDFDPTVPQIAARLAAMSTAASASFAAMHQEPGRTTLWDDLPITGGTVTRNVECVGNSFVRLYDLALAWATKGSALHDRPEVAAALVGATRFLADTGYNPGSTWGGNWWWWEIGNPKRLGDLMALLHDVMPAEDRDSYVATLRHFVPDPAKRKSLNNSTFRETGGNRTDKSLACAIRGILAKNGDEIALARDTLSDKELDGRYSLFQYATSGNGFYRDGSYIDHSYLPYVGTYGNVAISGIAALLALLGGSTWEVTDPNRTMILDAPEKSFAPFIWNGLMMETVRGRAVSRQRERDTHDGFSTISSVILLATGMASYAPRYHELAKGWLERTPGDYLASATIPQISRALAVIDGPVAPAPEPVGFSYFPEQERGVHRRPGWAFTVSTTSHRIGRYEWGNRENNLGWYQGDGMTYVYVDDDRDHFTDEFWPTVDPYRLPGTTVDRTPRANGEADGTGIPRGFKAWAGGLSLLDRFGVLGMDHLDHDKNLSAKKSWFALGESVVALGAGITGTSGHAVETTVENRNLGDRPSARITVDGNTLVPAAGDTTVTEATWAHVEGVGGYLFDGARVQVSRTPRTGTWRAINSGADTGGDTVERQRTFATLVLGHGVNPTDASYAYTLLPGASAERTRDLVAEPETTVLANAAAVQAIKADAKPGVVVLANFFGEATTSAVTASAPCSVGFLATSDTVEVAVSDPSRTTGMVEIVLPEITVRSVAAKDDRIEVTRLRGVRLSVNLLGTRGAAQRVTLRR